LLNEQHRFERLLFGFGWWTMSVYSNLLLYMRSRRFCPRALIARPSSMQAKQIKITHRLASVDSNFGTMLSCGSPWYDVALVWLDCQSDTLLITCRRCEFDLFFSQKWSLPFDRFSSSVVPTCFGTIARGLRRRSGVLIQRRVLYCVLRVKLMRFSLQQGGACAH
jgi:hypothetical protein